jgi:ATP-dependent Clp protease ATP-binding subunit ClpC
MFERFTPQARQVVVLAQEESRTLRHNYIGGEHLLIGLTREDETIAARVLEGLDITVERVRSDVLRLVPEGNESRSGQIPFTPSAKSILERSLREAQSLGDERIDTQHLLLSLTREKDGVPARVLDDLGVDAKTILEAVLRARPETPGEQRHVEIDEHSSWPCAPRPSNLDVRGCSCARYRPHRGLAR